ncbi:unnamed protein product [Cuscuta epithymum]|uniref:Replication factor A C-terminal domain-containing protein n=1 Tax=Cuscuta epithymum TaxID=186058 RepID=A0AAV0ETE2_9ASTE|nr:unnamed protein product [Cuscuta epithymum]
MAAELPIVSIMPETRPWTCRVTVVEKQNVRTAKASPMKFMPMILMDAAGNRVQATAFQGDIEGIDQHLALYSTYLVSNAYVKAITDMRFCVDREYPYVWSFTRRTLIQDVPAEEGRDFRQLAEADTTPFTEMYTAYLHEERINVLAAIVKKLPRTFVFSNGVQKPAWDVVLIDAQCIPVPFTIWEEFITRHGCEIEKYLQAGDFPLLLINRAAITLFQGLALSTRFDCHIELNPDGERALQLKKWVGENKEKINELLQARAYDDALTVIAKPFSQPLTALADLEGDLNENPIVWVSSKFRLSDTSEEGSYIGCDYCNRKVHGTEGVVFQCLFCGQKNGKTVKRFRLNAALDDGTNVIPVTLFTSEVLQLLKFVKVDPASDIDLESLAKNLLNIAVVSGVKRSRPNDEGLLGNPYAIVCVAPFEKTTPGSPIDIPVPLPTEAAPSTPSKRKLNFGSLGELTATQSPSSSKQVLAKDSVPEETLASLPPKQCRTSNT